MDIEQYQERALRTAKVLPTLAENLMHCALGIGSEAGELSETIACAWMNMPFDANNIIEEIGDACWYAAVMCHFMDWRFEDMFQDPDTLSEASAPLAHAVIGRNPPAMTLVYNSFAGEILTIVKAHVIYGKELDDELLKRKLELFISAASLLSNVHDIPFELVTLARNIDKLKMRYPDKYSDVAALERADKKPHLQLVN